jgi:hypothetical protein
MSNTAAGNTDSDSTAAGTYVLVNFVNTYEGSMLDNDGLYKTSFALVPKAAIDADSELRDVLDKLDGNSDDGPEHSKLSAQLGKRLWKQHKIMTSYRVVRRYLKASSASLGPSCVS